MAFIGVPCLSIIMKQANHGTGAGNNVEPPQRLRRVRRRRRRGRAALTKQHPAPCPHPHPGSARGRLAAIRRSRHAPRSDRAPRKPPRLRQRYDRTKQPIPERRPWPGEREAVRFGHVTKWRFFSALNHASSTARVGSASLFTFRRSEMATRSSEEADFAEEGCPTFDKRREL